MTEPDQPQPRRGDLGRLIQTIADDRGFDLGRYRRSYLERRLAARMRVLGLTTYRQYAERLARDPDEFAHLMRTLSISVTDFFRDVEMWDALRTARPGALSGALLRGADR